LDDDDEFDMPFEDDLEDDDYDDDELEDEMLILPQKLEPSQKFDSMRIR
jgi:hypothetical protein